LKFSKNVFKFNRNLRSLTMARSPRPDPPGHPRKRQQLGQPERPARSDEPPGAGSDRDRIIAAFLVLLADKPFEQVGLAEIASGAGVSLMQLREAFSSTFAILAAHMKEIDRQVLAGGDTEMDEEPPREKLFDVLMRRIEALAPHRPAVRSLMRSACRNPGLGFALNGLAVRSQQWMLTAADIDAAGPRGMVRAQGLACLFARVLNVWVDDEDPGLARTMAALDRELARGQRWSNFLDDVCRLAPLPRCRRDGWRSRRRRDDDPDVQPAVV
jgi:AcrR family transcriptional regulator